MGPKVCRGGKMNIRIISPFVYIRKVSGYQVKIVFFVILNEIWLEMADGTFVGCMFQSRPCVFM